MSAIAGFVFFFGVLAALISVSVFGQRRRTRAIGGVFAFLWSCLMFPLASEVERFELNAWYSAAAFQMVGATIEALNEGRNSQVIEEFTAMRASLHVEWEKRGNFKDLATTVAANLRSHKAEQGADYKTPESSQPPH